MSSKEIHPVPDQKLSLYQARDFAQRAGVTVRTLHHYDRLGLLKPSDRTEAGFRLYGEHELLRLQQIATLKLVGFPLKQIKALLERGPTDLPTALRLQRQIIDQRRRQLEVAGQAIDRAERLVAESGSLDWDAFRQILEVIEMQNNWDFVRSYYTEEQLAELVKRGEGGVAEKGQRDWVELIADVEAAVARGESPTSEHARSLAERWSALIEAFTGGNPGIAANLSRLYADKASWPAHAQAKPPYDDEVGAFIREVNAGRRTA
jgi:DNA-binding transcriptional MerR regulator